ncbi:MAG: ATP-binding protein [Cyanobacteria bacterium P01_C01_bin.73]
MKTELHVPSSLKFLTVVENWLLESLKVELDDGVDWPKVENRLRLVLVEAYSNVVRHAHKDQPNIPVLIRLELRAGELCIEVWDSGEGFELETYDAPDPKAFQEGGYGWLILSRLMDSVEYELQVNGKQNCLRMAANLKSSSDSPSDSPSPSDKGSPPDKSSPSGK